MPRVSVIVLNWNGKHHLKDCLDSLRNQSFKDFEVILSDNDSNDGSQDFVREHYPEVKILQNPSNLGYTGANNNAAKIANGEYLFFLNNDTKLDPSCIQYLVEALDSRQDCAICALKVLTFDGTEVSTCGCGVDVLGFVDLEPGYKLFFADGCSFFIRKSVFFDLGCFDKKHFIFNEELDLCWRALIYGYNICLDENAVVYHKVGATVTGGSFAKGNYTTSLSRRYLGERNSLRNLIKNYSLPFIIFILPLYLLVNAGEILMLALKRQFGVISGAYLKSYWYNLRSLPDTLNERRQIQSRRRVADRVIFAKMSKKVNKFNTFLKTGVPKFQ